MNISASNAVSEYQNTSNSSIAYADPHQLILRLMNGAIERIAQAKGCMQQKDSNNKGELIGKAIGIITGLSACLDHSQEGDLSDNLESLYEYMNLSLLRANMEDDTDKLDEVSKLLQEIRSAWVQIAKKDNI
jgi:flagellar secretion chaperone FliS